MSNKKKQNKSHFHNKWLHFMCYSQRHYKTIWGNFDMKCNTWKVIGTTQIIALQTNNKSLENKQKKRQIIPSQKWNTLLLNVIRYSQFYYRNCVFFFIQKYVTTVPSVGTHNHVTTCILTYVDCATTYTVYLLDYHTTTYSDWCTSTI